MDLKSQLPAKLESHRRRAASTAWMRPKQPPDVGLAVGLPNNVPPGTHAFGNRSTPISSLGFPLGCGAPAAAQIIGARGALRAQPASPVPPANACPRLRVPNYGPGDFVLDRASTVELVSRVPEPTTFDFYRKQEYVLSNRNARELDAPVVDPGGFGSRRRGDRRRSWTAGHSTIPHRCASARASRDGTGGPGRHHGL